MTKTALFAFSLAAFLSACASLPQGPTSLASLKTARVQAPAHLALPATVDLRLDPKAPDSSLAKPTEAILALALKEISGDLVKDATQTFTDQASSAKLFGSVVPAKQKAQARLDLAITHWGLQRLPGSRKLAATLEVELKLLAMDGTVLWKGQRSVKDLGTEAKDKVDCLLASVDNGEPKQKEAPALKAMEKTGMDSLKFDPASFRGVVVMAVKDLGGQLLEAMSQAMPEERSLPLKLSYSNR